jgi:hypothetical protein
MNIVINALQFSRLLALASAFGHWWARVVRDLPPRALWTTQGIEAVQAAALKEEDEENPGWPFNGGVNFATTHRTASGRLEWDVSADGTVHLRGCRRGEAVGRPGEASVVVLKARMSTGGGVAVSFPLGVAQCSPGVVDTTIKALMALGLTEEDAWRALGPDAVEILAKDRVGLTSPQVVQARKAYDEAVSAMMQNAPWHRDGEPEMRLQALKAAEEAFREAQAMYAWAEMRRPAPLMPVKKEKVRHV